MNSPEPPLIKRAAQALWRDLPVWFFLYQAHTTFHLVLKTLVPPRPEFAWTVIFPLFWVVLFQWWCRGAPTPRRLVLIVCACALPLLPISLLPLKPMTNAEILPFFEAGTLICVAVLGAHCFLTRTRGDFFLFYGVGLLYALVLENGGILMGFFHEPGYWLHIPGFPGPLATAFGWTTVFYTSLHIAEALSASARSAVPLWVPPLIAAAAALSLDLQLDPAATAAGWWIWHSTLAPAYLGVPWVNYTAWLCALAPFFALVHWARTRGWSLKRVNVVVLTALPMLLVFELILVMLLTALAEGSWRSPSLLLFRAFLGWPIQWSLLGLGCLLILLAALWVLRRRPRAPAPVPGLWDLALCAKLLREIEWSPLSDQDLQFRLRPLLRDVLDPMQRLDQIIGRCLEEGWLRGPPEARRITGQGAEFLRRFLSSASE